MRKPQSNAKVNVILVNFETIFTIFSNLVFLIFGTCFISGY